MDKVTPPLVRNLIPSSAQVRWLASCDLAGVSCPDWRSWLEEAGSLTARLRSEAKQSFQVQVLQEFAAVPYAEELQLLGCGAKTQTWVREVFLKVDAKPWVFARSVMPLQENPKQTRTSWQEQILQTGNQPLGHLLFKGAGVKRGPLFFCQAASLLMPAELAEPSLWGRASCFHTAENKILVTEHFLAPMARQLKLTGLDV